MTDYSPEALRDLVKKIGHRAIETQLHMLPDGQWDGSADEGFYGVSWDGRLPPVTGPTGPIRLKWHMPGMGMSAGFLPGLTKVGEGYDAAMQGYYEYEIDPWVSIYEPWMSKIEDAFRGWDSLPDPASYQAPVDAMRAAITDLTPVPTGAGGNDGDGTFSTTYSDVDLDSALDTIQTIVGGFAAADDGLLIYTFLSSYGPTRVRDVMGNQAQVGIILGISLLGEQKIWQGARTDIMAIADKAYESMRPGGAGGGSGFDLEVAKAFAGLLGTFVPAPLAQALSIGTAALDLVETLVPPEPAENDNVGLTGFTIDEVYESMVDLISKVDTHVYDQERDLDQKTLNGMLDTMWGGSASQFHIDPNAGVEPDLKHAKKIDVHHAALKKVGYQLVPRVAANMGKAAHAAQGADRSGIWSRSGIGYGYNGPYSTWAQVLGEFDKVTTGSAKELVEAGHLLAVGAGFLEDTDGSSDAELAGILGDLARGKDEWVNKPPPPPVIPHGIRGTGGRMLPF